MIKFSARSTYFIISICIAALVSYTFYLEAYQGFVPCPLCILQRCVFCILGILFFFSAVVPWHKTGRLVLGITNTLFAVIGLLLAGRQVWLQHLPLNTNADCGVSLQYLLKILPWQQAMAKVLYGTAECAQKGGMFLSLSLAEWALMCFILFLFFCLGQIKWALRM